MGTTLAPAETTATETAVAVPATFINPLSIEVPADRIDAAINGLVDAALGTVEDEMHRLARRRQLASAIRGIRSVKEQLDELNENDAEMGMTTLVIDSHRPDLLKMFAVLNPAAEAKVVEICVDGILEPYKSKFEEPTKKAKRGKSSGG
jgi:hypothetical protein